MSETTIVKLKGRKYKSCKIELSKGAGTFEIRDVSSLYEGFCESDGCERARKEAKKKMDAAYCGKRNVDKLVFIYGHPAAKLCKHCAKDWLRSWEEALSNGSG